ncbi:MAG: Eco57I restriction-modification methylase domain-containing protein [Clostridia bacterium]|nr:Eco57I restriction-modification methylase domain-containing protein [Clostridia bacterium]
MKDSYKLDFVIGNPPYQEKSEGDKPADDSVYSYFMDAAYSVSKKVELITPSRFLFEGGNIPKAWNRKMLDDTHFKVLQFDSSPAGYRRALSYPPP